jgi:BT1 family
VSPRSYHHPPPSPPPPLLSQHTPPAHTRSFIGTPLTVFLVQSLNAQPAQQNTIGVLLSIPWSFKLVYGFISDVVPIAGLRRKPYFALGFALHR